MKLRDKVKDGWEGMKIGLLLGGFIGLGYVMGSLDAWDACRAVAKAAAR